MIASKNAYFSSKYLDERHERPRYKNRLQESPTSQLTQNGRLQHNPDDLSEELTPAQLNYLAPKRHRPSHHDTYYQKRHSEDSKDSGSEFSGYYIAQQKRYNQAEKVKPKLYTHKTFQDVFERDRDDRLNPIDVVFDDPEKVRDAEQKQKLTRAVRTVQRKIGKDDYASYDYYVQQKLEAEHRRKAEEDEALRREREAVKLRKRQEKEEKRALKKAEKQRKRLEQKEREQEKERERDLFVDDPSDDEMNNMWKRRWKSTKKALGTNLDMYQRAIERQEELRQEAAESVESLESVVSVPSTQPSMAKTPRFAGPNDNFSPMWNYILSWVVYSPRPKQEMEIDEIADDKIESVEEAEVALPLIQPKSQKLKKRNPLKNYKAVLRNWNQPAAHFLAGEQKSEPSVISKQTQSLVSLPKTICGEAYPEIYEMSINESEPDDELIYNPATNLFEPLHKGEPPTSADAMIQPRFATLHEGGPTKIVSNINALIKSIRIMRIIFAPIDVIAEHFPTLQTVVILLELVIFVWILYELSLLIDAMCMAIKAICAPMIAIGRFMNRVV